MPRKPRKSRAMKPAPLSQAWRAFFETGVFDAEGEDKVEIFMASGNQEKIAVVWKIYQHEMMSDWVNDHPCSRPWVWWEVDALKEAVPGWDGENFNSAQRKRLGGIGTPSHEVLSVWGVFEYGLPESWVSKFDEEYYNGRRKDIHGNIIPTNYKEGDFKGITIDPLDAPVFESEASYLDRHGLLTPAEKKFLEKHPELVEPEKVVFDEDEDEGNSA